MANVDKTLPKQIALAIGVASAWPLVYMVAFIGTFFLVFAESASPDRAPGAADAFEWLFIVHMWTMLLIVVLLVFYIRDVFKNSTLQDDKRTLWAVVLFMGAPIAMPVYWWHYVWQRSIVGTDRREPDTRGPA